jgi:hypothetical protein
MTAIDELEKLAAGMERAGETIRASMLRALANTQLKKALESLRPVVNPPYEWEPDPVGYARIIDAALAPSTGSRRR